MLADTAAAAALSVALADNSVGRTAPHDAFARLVMF